MATMEQPITRTDLREELALFREEIRTHYATKADLERMVLRLVLAQIAIGGAIVAVLRFWQ